METIATFRGVYGNIDGAAVRKEVPLHQAFQCEGLVVSILHIGGYPGRYTPEARALINRNRPRLFITGHSHILKVINDRPNNLLHMNPGALGKQGLHQVQTMLLFDVEKARVGNLRVVEFDRKSL